MGENDEDSHAMHADESADEIKERHGSDKEALLQSQENPMAEKKEENRRKRGRKKLVPGEQPTQKIPVSKESSTPSLDRPARERKSIKRFGDLQEKEKGRVKEFKIGKGSGTCLKDIPNVVFKLSKRKASEEPVKLLHKLMYGKHGKPHYAKTNILQFSGFVWSANKEKEKARIKEKLEKCVKENLFQMGDLLDLDISKKSTKKEDLVVQLFEFLDSPHQTTEKLLQEEQKKRKRTPLKGERMQASRKSPHKRQKRQLKESDQEDADVDREEVEEEPEEEPEEVPKKKRSLSARKPKDKSEPKTKMLRKHVKKSRIELEEELEEEPVEEELAEEPADQEVEETDGEEPAKGKSSSRLKNRSSDKLKHSTSKKGVLKPDERSVYEPREEDLEDGTEAVKSKLSGTLTKKRAPKEPKVSSGGVSKERKKMDDDSSKVIGNKKNKDEEDEDHVIKAHKKEKKAGKEESKPSPPTDDELRLAIRDLLRDADFSTVTFTDAVKQLEANFNVDLSQIKGHVKVLIQDEIRRIVDDDE